MKRLDTNMIVIGFALLHSLMAFACRKFGLPDELILTLLTMLMISLVCNRRAMNVEFTAIAIVAGNLAGYALGFIFPKIFAHLSANPVVTAVLSTFTATLLLGYSTLGVSYLMSSSRANSSEDSHLLWIITAISVVFFARLTVSTLFSFHVISDPNGDGRAYFLASFAALVFVLFLFLASYVIYAKNKAENEREKRHLAQFRYMKLSQQVNPHFLFNSLNILDGLVCEGEQELASTYIHKLAALYRYMLKNEEETTVKIIEEMDFVEKYIDLLKVRFQEGLIVEAESTPAALQKSIVPCSIQLLIENATKHNAIVADNPLKIRIRISEESVVVTNNICPKLSPVVSTGVGLKYIKQQYEDICGKSIEITKTDEEYSVELPLI